MQRVVLPNDSERPPGDSVGAAERRVTLMFPTTRAEYEQARTEVESFPPSLDETRPGDCDEDERVMPAPEDRFRTAGTPGDGRRALRRDHRRAAARVWDLPDLANATDAHDTAPGDPDAMERPDAIAVVDSAEAIDLLFEDDASGSDDAATENDAGDEGAVREDRCGRTRPVPVVNLKHDRGPIPEHVRAAFRELCRQPRIDSLLKSIDALIEPLERSVVSDLEAAKREVAALRRHEVTPERLGDTGGADSADEGAERIAKTC